MRRLAWWASVAVLWTLTINGPAAEKFAGSPAWTQFRGEGASGVHPTAKPPLKWTANDHVRWKADLPGGGSSSPIVTGNRVFVTCFADQDGGLGNVASRALVCVDRTSGKILWSNSTSAGRDDAYEGFLREHGFASNTAVTDGERVYVFYGKSGVLSYDLDGNELWRTNVGTESSNRRWGSAASLVLSGDHVIVNASEESRSIRALDKKTGKEVWKAEANSLELSYSTPALVTGKDNRVDLMVAAPGEVWGLNPETGKLRWYSTLQISGNISPSVISEGDVIYLTGGRPAATQAIRVGGKGDMTSSNVLWTKREGSYVATPVLYDGRLYWADDRGQAYCIDAKTGESIYHERLPGLGGGGGRPVYASPVIADGKVYVVSRWNGTYVLPATKSFEVLSQNSLDDDSDFNATPAVVDNDLLIRSDKALYCIGDAK